jgi:hypothetical protein
MRSAGGRNHPQSRVITPGAPYLKTNSARRWTAKPASAPPATPTATACKVGLSAGANYGESGSHQGSVIIPYGKSGTAHASGQGRDTEGAFGEETADNNPSPLNDYRDKDIAERELG